MSKTRKLSGLELFALAKEYEEAHGMKHYDKGPYKGTNNHTRVTKRMKNKRTLEEWNRERKSFYVAPSQQPSSAANAAQLPIPATQPPIPAARISPRMMSLEQFSKYTQDKKPLLEACEQGNNKEIEQILEDYQPDYSTKAAAIRQAVMYNQLSTLELLLHHEQFQDPRYARDALFDAVTYFRSEIIAYVIDKWNVDPTVEYDHLGRNIFKQALHVLYPYQDQRTRQQKEAIFIPLLKSKYMRHLAPLMDLLRRICPRSHMACVGQDNNTLLSIISPYLLRAFLEEPDPYSKKKAAIILRKRVYDKLSTADKRHIDDALKDYRFMRNHGSKTRKLNLIEYLMKHHKNIPVENANQKIIDNVYGRVLQSNEYSAAANAAFASPLPVKRLKQLPPGPLSDVVALSRKKGGKNKRNKTRKH